MSSDTPEFEIVDRLTDSVKRSADLVAQICRCAASDLMVSPHMLISLRSSLNQASGASYQLGHARRNPKFFDLRDSLEKIAHTSSICAMGMTAEHHYALAQMGRVLDMLHDVSLNLAKEGVMKHTQALEMMDVRATVMQ